MMILFHWKIKCTTQAENENRRQVLVRYAHNSSLFSSLFLLHFVQDKSAYRRYEAHLLFFREKKTEIFYGSVCIRQCNFLKKAPWQRQKTIGANPLFQYCTSSLGIISLFSGLLCECCKKNSFQFFVQLLFVVNLCLSISVFAWLCAPKHAHVPR